MTTRTATVYDFEPAQLRRSMGQQTTAAAGVLAVPSDGAVVAQHFLNFAGFTWKESKFFLLIVGLCGGSGRALPKHDEELAAFARATDRTIRTWRADFKRRAQVSGFAPLLIVDGEYDRDRQRYAPTSYSLWPHFAYALERAVAKAQGAPGYGRDRLAALEDAACEFYDALPDAPPPGGRKKKPRPSLRSVVVQGISNAKKNLERGRRAFDELPARTRVALVAGEGEMMREMLLALRAELDGMLAEVSPETVDDAGLDDMPENSSGIPPSPGTPAGEERSAASSDFRVEEREDIPWESPDDGEEADGYDSPVPRGEAEELWGSAFRGLSAPRVRSAHIPLSSPPVDAADAFLVEPAEVGRSAPPARPVEELEAEAIRDEGRGLLRDAEGSP